MEKMIEPAKNTSVSSDGTILPGNSDGAAPEETVVPMPESRGAEMTESATQPNTNADGATALQTRSGVVCIIGRPSAGKSTFLNSVCGGMVSIVSPLPQTTRSAVRGILTAEQGQIIFIDTPGYHISEKKINRRMQLIAENRLQEAEAILYLIDAVRPFGEEESAICALLKDKQKRLIIGINKTDSPAASPGQTRVNLMHALPDLPQELIFDLSALEKTGLAPVLAALFSLLPEGKLFYPEDFYTDQPVDFRIAEIIRGQAISRLYEEIPHALYVNIQDMEMAKTGKELFVRAFLCVERESQKSMVIGKGAALIKAIRVASQKELGKIFPYRVKLDLQVRVDKNWRQKDRVLQTVLQE